MKKILFFLLLVLPLFLVVSFYFLDKAYFLCPIDYKRDIVIRCDTRGNGFFSAKRNGNRAHEGIDLFADIGTPVKACRLGLVVNAAENKGMGKFVVIRHGGNLITIYGHLSAIYVRKNQVVRQGYIVGRVGKTGNANYRDIMPHLHFEIRRNGVPQDPLEYME